MRMEGRSPRQNLARSSMLMGASTPSPSFSERVATPRNSANPRIANGGIGVTSLGAATEGRRYAQSGTTSGGSGMMVKQAALETTFTAPGFYSPYHTPSAWQIPTNRHEVYRWCFHPNALVTMGDFTQKRIEDIELGDEVIGGDGERGIVTVKSDKKLRWRKFGPMNWKKGISSSLR